MNVRTVCVFCGAHPGVDPAFVAGARALGRAIAESGRALVYGGGKVGLMGAVADTALSHGGKVIGVIPQQLTGKEIAHQDLTELHVVGTMHERKAMMADRADAFVALPGGLGTLEEFFEVWTWGQLGIHHKPFGILELAGFFAPLLAFLDRLVERGFVSQAHRDMLVVGGDAMTLLESLERLRPPPQPKWLDRGQE